MCDIIKLTQNITIVQIINFLSGIVTISNVDNKTYMIDCGIFHQLYEILLLFLGS